MKKISLFAGVKTLQITKIQLSKVEVVKKSQKSPTNSLTPPFYLFQKSIHEFQPPKNASPKQKTEKHRLKTLQKSLQRKYSSKKVFENTQKEKSAPKKSSREQFTRFHLLKSLQKAEKEELSSENEFL